MSENKSENKSSILETAKKRFEQSRDFFELNEKLALEDSEFIAGEQWPAESKRDRELDGRPCLVINRLPQFVRQVTNDYRQNRPSIKIFPVDDKADVETAKIIQGLVRHIEYNSGADIAYDHAFDGAVKKGFGYFRIVTDYSSFDSFDQDILIKKVADDFSVRFDPFSIEPDGSDAEFVFVFQDLTEEEYKLKYPDSELSKMRDWDTLATSKQDWMSEGSVRVAEYFYKEYVTKTLYKLVTGETVIKDKSFRYEDSDIVTKRETKVPVVKWCLINGIEILEEKEFLSQWIPIIPVYGEQVVVDGQRVYEGIVRHAKDSQRMYNYWASSETETISLAPRAPYLAASGQIPEKFKEQWANANRKNYPYLIYEPKTAGGQVIGAPQRNVYEPPVQAITNARMLSADDMKSTTGIYDSALGAQSRETSGIAIRGRQAQSQTSNYHFSANFVRSLRHAGRIILELLPKIYDAPRVVRALGEDNSQEIVLINQLFNKDGKQVSYNIGIGKYDVVIETGPSYATKRQEALASMIDLTKAYPQVANVAADLMIKNMDWPGASEIAERVKKTLPPNLLDDNKQQQIPPQIQAQMQQMNQMIEQMTAQLNEKSEMIKTKSIELESKERIEFAKIEADLIKAKMSVIPEQALFDLQSQINQMAQRLQMLDMNEPIEQDFNSNHEMQEGYVSDQQLTPESYEQNNQPTAGNQYAGQPIIEGDINGQY